MSMQSLKRRLDSIENRLLPSEIEFKQITPDMNLNQATQVYKENLRLLKNSYRPPPEPAPDMTLEEAARRYQDNLRSFREQAHDSSA